MLSKTSNTIYLFVIFLASTLGLTAPIEDSLQSCTSRQWNLQGFSAFTAGPSGASPGSPDGFDLDHISFRFTDENFGVSAQCYRSVAKGAGTLSDGKSYPCGGFGMSFQYFGSSIQLKRVGVECDNVTYTLSGATTLPLNCYPLFGGTNCESPVQVNVNIAFLEQTSP